TAIFHLFYRFAPRSKDDESRCVAMKGETHLCVHRSQTAQARRLLRRLAQLKKSPPENVAGFWLAPWWVPSSNGTTFSSTLLRRTLSLLNYSLPQQVRTTNASSRW